MEGGRKGAGGWQGRPIRQRVTGNFIYFLYFDGNKDTVSNDIRTSVSKLTNYSYKRGIALDPKTLASDIPPLDIACLPPFLPSSKEVPVVHSQAACKKLLYAKANKAMGADSIPPRIIKEFACELAEPVTKIFNALLSTGEVPTSDNVLTSHPLRS